MDSIALAVHLVLTSTMGNYTSEISIAKSQFFWIVENTLDEKTSSSKMAFLYDMSSSQKYIHNIDLINAIRTKEQVAEFPLGGGWSSNQPLIEEIVEDSYFYQGCDCITLRSVHDKNIIRLNKDIPLPYTYQIKCKSLLSDNGYYDSSFWRKISSFLPIYSPTNINGYEEYDMVLSEWIHSETLNVSKIIITDIQVSPNVVNVSEKIKALLLIPEVTKEQFEAVRNTHK